MRIQAGAIVAVMIAVLGLPSDLSAQMEQRTHRGLFGERELGKPLKPGRSRFRSGLERGPSGSFQGRTTANRGTIFQPRSRTQPSSPALPPEAYNLEPEMVPGYLEARARRMTAAQQEQQRQLQELQQRQLQQLRQQQQLQAEQQRLQERELQDRTFRQPPQQQPYRPVRPRTDRYLPPKMPTQGGASQPPPQTQRQPAAPGPTRQELQNSPDRWFRGGPSQPEQQAPRGGAGPNPQRYGAASGLGPVGTLGPGGVAGPRGMSRTSVAALGSRITQNLGQAVRTPISATVRGDTVTLQGTVASAADRQLAERIALMEPGVRQIENRITVADE